MSPRRSSLLWPAIRRVSLAGGGPLLVVLDGPEYARRLRLVSRLRLLVERGEVPAHDVALVTPFNRLETYSASSAYARALSDALDALDGGGRQTRVGLGCSLGALALLHAHRQEPRAFAGLFLQSGSFFQKRTDPQESGFVRFRRIDRFVGEVLRSTDAPTPVPTTITCALDEENYANNQRMGVALAALGYPVELCAARGGHDWPTWRDAVGAHLPRLLRRVWRQGRRSSAA